MTRSPHEEDRWYIYKWNPTKIGWVLEGWSDLEYLAMTIYINCRAAEKQLWKGETQLSGIGRMVPS